MYEGKTRAVRKSVRSNGFIWTTHARDRCQERSIDVGEVRSALPAALVIEEQHHGRDPKVVMQCTHSDGRIFYCVLALPAEKSPVLITVCWFKEDVWEKTTQGYRRR